jgi:hypothetical protein
MIMKHLTILFFGLLVLSGCKKNEADVDEPLAARLPFANIKLANNGADVFQWTYQGDERLTNIKWTDLSGGSSKAIGESASVTYDGNKLVKLETTAMNGEKITYTAAYNGEKLSKITSANSSNPRIWNFEAEYDAQGRISQLNRFRTNGSAIEVTSNYVLTYDANQNISKAVFTQGASSRAYIFKYDAKDNRAYQNPILLFISMGEVSPYMNHFWGLPFLITLSKNHITEMATEGTTEKHLYTYQFDGEGYINAVKDDWTLASGAKQVSDWTIKR